METKKRQPGGPASVPNPSRATRGLALRGLTLLLGLGAAAPARATSGVISTPVTGPITVNAGETLHIVTGGSVTVASGFAVNVNGGTLDMSGGAISVSGGGISVLVDGGTASISGGTISGTFGQGVEVDSGTVGISGGTISGAFGDSVLVNGGALTLSGGSVTSTSPVGAGVTVEGGGASLSGGTISGPSYGVFVGGGAMNISGGTVSGGVVGVVGEGGTVSIFGCNLVLSGGSITGILADGTPINTSVAGSIVLDNRCTPVSLATLVTQSVADPGVAQGLIDKLNAIATAIAQGNANAKAGIVGAFIKQVKAQTGKSITPQQAAVLIQFVNAL
jgi:hypothetical protein